MFLKLRVEHYILVQTLIAGGLNIGEVMNGYGVAWSAPIIPKLQNPEETPLPYLVSESNQSWIGTAIYAGCFGSCIIGLLVNKIGRRKTLIYGGILNLVSYVVLTAARNLAMIYIGRSGVGFGLAILTVTSLIYLGEIASPNIRGKILTSMGFFHAIGGLVVYSVGPYVSYAGVGYVAIALNVVYIVTCYFLPESPMFYVINNDEASARSALQYLGRDVDISSELKAMMDKVQEQQQQKHLWRELFTARCNRISLLITVSVSFFQQSSGIIVVIFFATSIFKDAGSSIEPDIATIIIGATFAVGACISPFFIEKYGRRVLLMISTAGCSVSMVVLGTYFYLKVIEHPYIGSLGWVPLASMVVVIFMYSVGLSIIPNTLTGELFTPNARGLGSSISLLSGWVSGLLSTSVFGYAVAALGSHITFWIFATINGLAFLFVMGFVPETKGKSLMEIQTMLENRGSKSLDINLVEKDTRL